MANNTYFKLMSWICVLDEHEDNIFFCVQQYPCLLLNHWPRNNRFCYPQSNLFSILPILATLQVMWRLGYHWWFGKFRFWTLGNPSGVAANLFIKALVTTGTKYLKFVTCSISSSLKPLILLLFFHILQKKKVHF